VRQHELERHARERPAARAARELDAHGRDAGREEPPAVRRVGLGRPRLERDLAAPTKPRRAQARARR
jgi:hypothetical protein